jgi:hypothetical protein
MAVQFANRLHELAAGAEAWSRTPELRDIPMVDAALVERTKNGQYTRADYDTVHANEKSLQRTVDWLHIGGALAGGGLLIEHVNEYAGAAQQLRALRMAFGAQLKIPEPFTFDAFVAGVRATFLGR